MISITHCYVVRRVHHFPSPIVEFELRLELNAQQVQDAQHESEITSQMWIENDIEYMLFGLSTIFF